MSILTKVEINESLQSEDPDSLFLIPLLEENQVGNVTVDLRLGYDFLVSIFTRNPHISIAEAEGVHHRGVESYFQETRREIGERFVLYPNQVVLTTTVEYLSLPKNMYADILSRSSYTRLGIHVNTMVQPGFKGCIPLELFNHGNNAVELVVGSRICQARFFRNGNNKGYITGQEVRKYYGDVRPSVSKADCDGEIEKLKNWGHGLSGSEESSFEI